MNYVMQLSSVDLPDSDQVGRKAAVLGALRRAGFPAPDGFAVRAEALEATVRDAGLDLTDRAGVAAALPTIALPADLVAELRQALERLGDVAVAVRSSGAAEDLADRSYAGQYESFLGVRGFDALAEAVRACWASAFSERLAAYHGDGGVPGLGVLVQRMVDAEGAGVAFSANPVTGDASQTLVSAVRGLGDKLMGGEVSADEWTVSAGVASLTSGGGEAIDASSALRVADMAQRIAAHFGAPQDIEWAIADGSVHVLQARPITALRDAAEQTPIPIEVPDGFWVRDRTSDAPWTPMKESVFMPVYRRVAGGVFAFTNGSVPQLASIGGWVYLTTPPDTFRDLAVKMERIATQVAAGVPRALVDRWNGEWKPEFAARIAALRDADLTGLSVDEMEKHATELTRLFGELHDVYFQLTGAAVELLGQLGVVCEDLLGWAPPQTLRLRGGLTGDHMGAAIRLGELAALAAHRPAVAAYLDNDGADVARLSEIDADFAAAFADYVRQYAHRTVGFDITEPTLAEQPATLLNLVRAQLREPYDFASERAALAARQSEALEEARAALSGRSEAERAAFEQAYADSDAAGPVRDEKVFYAVSLWALLRYATLELGRRLAAADAIDAGGDAFFLGLDEALAALRAGADHGDLRAATWRRRAEHAWASAHPGPQFYGAFPAPPTPDPEVTPSPAAMRAFRVGQWSMGLWSGGQREDAADGSLRGVAASSGRYTGPVRVIRSVTEFGKLRRGDVLVCPETTAQWAVLFPSVGALVTDHGSLLSHPAIIAREYGVPAVVATGNATQTFHDGQIVTVDGATGMVRPA